MKRKEKLEKARRDELESGNKIKYEEVKPGTPEWEEAYDDWSDKYWEYKKQQQLDDDLFDAEGCLKLFIFMLIIGFVGYWVVKILFSIKYF
jgi:hypothetical protein